MKNIPPKLRPWFEARRRLRLSHATIQMARELGMNPAKLDRLVPTPDQRWKAPLHEFIADCYQKSHGRRTPEQVRTLEQVVDMRAQRRQASRQRRAAAISAPLDDASEADAAVEAECEALAAAAAETDAGHVLRAGWIPKTVDPRPEPPADESELQQHSHSRAAGDRPCGLPIEATMLEGPIRELLNQFAAAWNSNDGQSLADFFIDDAALVDPFGERADGRTAIARMYDRHFADMLRGTSSRIELLRARPVAAGHAFADCEQIIDAADGSMRLSLHLAALLQRCGDRWRFVDARPHAYADPPARQAPQRSR